jgi:hypothetical protein
MDYKIINLLLFLTTKKIGEKKNYKHIKVKGLKYHNIGPYLQ